MKKFLRWILLPILLLIVAGALAFPFLPWKPWAENKLASVLAAKGLTPVSLKIGSIGLRSVTLDTVSVGAETPLTLDHLTLNYSMREVISGKLQTLTLHGLTLEARQGKEGWSVTGLESFFNKPTSSEPARIPVTSADFAVLPFTRAALTDSSIRVVGSAWEADLPVTLTWENGAAPKLKYEATHWSGKTKAVALSTGKVEINAALDAAANTWRGTWNIGEVVITQETISLPPLNCKGTLEAVADAAKLGGTCGSADRAFGIEFVLDYSLAKPDASHVTILRANLPWSGGTISTRNVKASLSGKKPVTIRVNVDKVPIATLMQSLTGDKATATGVVSGVLPITIAPDGRITFSKASLRAEEPGVIALSPAAIPGDQAQVALVRDVLKNLHYSLLSLDVDSEAGNSLGVVLIVEGRNPDVENGRAVKLRVQLSGDVLELVKQNMLLMTDPQKFLQQETR